MMSNHNTKDEKKQPQKTMLLAAMSSLLTREEQREEATPVRGTPNKLDPPHTARPLYKRPAVIVSALCLVVLLIGGFFAWLRLNQAPLNVTLYQVHPQNVDRYIGGSGTIFPQQQLNIAYPAVERVISVYVQPGDQVSPNQPLIQLDLSQLNAQIKQASENVSAAQNYLNSVALENQLVVDQAQRAYDMAIATYNSLVAQSSSPTLHNGTLVSPVKGVITQVDISAGDVVGANRSLMTLVVESTVIARVQIPLANINQVYVGQLALVTPSALPSLNIQGKVSTVIPQASANGDTFEVWVNITNMNNTLLPGMDTFVRLAEPIHAIVVPRLAVLNPDQGPTVYVVRRGHAYLQPIQIGGYTDDFIIVDAGLSAGDTVVLSGVDALQNGRAVHIVSIEHP